MLEEVIAQELIKVELTADEDVLEEEMACGIGGCAPRSSRACR